MNLSQLEEAIQLSQSSGERKAEASRFLDQLRVSDESWKVGLGLFFESKNDVARHFGLTLTREYLSSKGRNELQLAQVRTQIREALMGWTSSLVAANQSIPVFLSNNLVAIITLLIKSDYPEVWTDPFAQLLQLGRQNPVGLDIVVRVFDEIEIEVVGSNRLFDESPGRHSTLSHNTLIKDTMRQTSVISDVVDFLCQAVTPARPIQDGVLSDRILRCLARLIAWIDVNLITKESTMRTIYQALDDRKLSSAACVCLLELAKKGMDPVLKVLTIHSIGLAQVLAAHVPTPDNTSAHDDGYEEDFGELITIVYLELLGCWSKFEDNLSISPDGKTIQFEPSLAAAPSSTSPPTLSRQLSKSVPGASAVPTPSDGPALLSTLPIVVGYLNDYWRMLMAVFAHEDTCIAVTVIPALTRLVGVLKTQMSMRPEAVAEATAATGVYFSAREHMHSMLGGIYRQLQYRDDFEFDPEDEDDAEVMEANKDVRKLFVNCCRVVPDLCLELIAAILPTLPQPLSRAPFPQLEAALRLLYSFGECGQAHKDLVKQGTFPALLAALHRVGKSDGSTDIASHPHPQVILGYFELAARYCKQMDVASVQAVVACMVGERGVRHASGHIRQRSAYFLFKMADAMEGKASLLLPVVSSFSDLLLTDFGVASPLGEAAELHLLEAVGLMTSSVHQCGEAELQQQQRFVQEVVRVLILQIQALLSHPQLQRYADEIGEAVAHRISSLTSLTKGFNAKTRPDIVPVINATGAIVCAATQALAHHPTVRTKIITFCHCCLRVAGPSAVDTTLAVLPPIIDRTESPDCEHTVQLMANLVESFKGACVPHMDALYGPVLRKIMALRAAFEEQQRHQAGLGGDVDLAHVEMERVNLQKQYLLFIQSLVANGCSACLISETNVSMLDEVLQRVVTGLQGGEGEHLAGGQEGRLAVRKTALLILSGLAMAWMNPSETVPMQLKTAFSSLVFDRALPLTLSMCTDGRTLNVHDATTQSVLNEAAVLLWTCQSMAPADTVARLQVVLPSLGWPPASCTALLEMLVAGSPAGTFKESFKRFIRANRR